MANGLKAEDQSGWYGTMVLGFEFWILGRTWCESCLTPHGRSLLAPRFVGGALPHRRGKRKFEEKEHPPSAGCPQRSDPPSSHSPLAFAPSPPRRAAPKNNDLGTAVPAGAGRQAEAGASQQHYYQPQNCRRHRMRGGGRCACGAGWITGRRARPRPRTACDRGTTGRLACACLPSSMSGRRRPGRNEPAGH